MSFTNGLPRIATYDEVNSKYWKFCCRLCGYEFKEGDSWRWQYTNDISGTYGNIIICQNCDTYPNTNLMRRKWKERCEEWETLKADPKWRFFFKNIE